MPKKQLVSVLPVNDYITVHPALDFYNGSAIVAVGGKWLLTYNDDSVDFDSKPFCIISDGDKFGFSKLELAKRNLFHTGQLDIPNARWDFADIEAFSQEPSSLDFSEIYQIVKDQWEHYLDFVDPRHHTLLTCFVIYTYFYPLFSFAPVLQLWGEFQTGKTKICSLFEALVFNPINSANISSASVFRLIQSRRAVILLDESEDLMTAERARDIRNMMLAGTGKSGETFRQEKDVHDSYHTQSFKVFSPKVIANIAGIDLPALQSRIIKLVTTGTSNPEKANRTVDQEDKKWQEVRNKLYRSCLCRFNEVVGKRDNLPEHGLSGRTLGAWQGILTMANLADNGAFKEMVEYATENKEDIEAELLDKAEEPSLMLDKLIELVGDNNVVTLGPDEILQHFRMEFGIDSKAELGKRLGKLGIHNKVFSTNGHSKRCYRLVKSQLQVLRNGNKQLELPNMQ